MIGACEWLSQDGQDLPPIATLAPGGQLATVAGGMTPSTGGGALTPSPAPSPGVDSALHSIWVDIVDQEDLHFGRRLGAQSRLFPDISLTRFPRG